MRLGFIGDIVGKPGRDMIKKHLPILKDQYRLDFVVANAENASHGFGLSIKNANELLSYGIDLITGGNHSFDRKEIMQVMDSLPILRVANLPQNTVGKGVSYIEKNGFKLCVINLMGYFAMPMVDNPFVKIQEILENLEPNDAIFIDFHAEATSEKNALFKMLQKKVQAIAGTHTHVGTDDLVVQNSCGYVSDVGLTGCRDKVIGMSEDAPIKRFLTGLHYSFDIDEKCKKILQMVVFEFENNSCKDAFKVKILENESEHFIQRAYFER